LRKNNQPNDGYPRGTVVEVRNGDINGAMRRFKKRVQEENIIQEYRDKQEYTKPSIVRKRAKAAARARWLKKLAKDRDV
jgi:small subunit ribosomal protein S21